MTKEIREEEKREMAKERRGKVDEKKDEIKGCCLPQAKARPGN